jgi:hypothetical protein
MKWLLSLIVGTCLYLPTLSYTQIIEHRISDDGYARVPLQFPFPYYGSVFTESYMFSNGVVGFLNPNNSWCCNGFDLRTSNGTPFNFAIMPLQTDLLNYNGRFLTEGTTTYQRYKWENISEFGSPGNLNTFGVEIRPSGYIGMHYEKVNISPGRTVTIGMTGNTALGEYTQYYHGPGFTSVENVSYITQSTGSLCAVDPLSSTSCPGYQAAYLVQQCSINALYDTSCPGYNEAYTAQQCSLDPLYSNQCPGYEQAYFNQQCSLSSLYSSQCPGYETAYLNQQCSLNSLYSTQCPGYQTAYLNQQCSLNSLYSTQCPGYQTAYFNQQCSLNSLYSTQCPGYETAYFNQQCSISPLYSSTCPGYAQAYLTQQCSINPLYDRTCNGYEAAYFNQQCSLNTLYNQGCTGYAEAYFTYQCTQSPLYNSGCTGYAEAYYAQQCTLNALYDVNCPGYGVAYLAQQCSLSALYNASCPGYAQAYFSQQCTTNQLYSKDCPGYAQAYALANVVPATSTNSNKVVVSVPQLQVSTMGTISVTTPVIADPVVNEIVTRAPATTSVTGTASNNRTQDTVATSTVNTTSSIEEKKESTSSSSKPAASTSNRRQIARDTVSKNEAGVASASAPVLVDRPMQVQQLQIVDMLYLKMVNKKPIQDNNKSYYNLIMNSQHKHEEMVDGQYK